MLPSSNASSPAARVGCGVCVCVCVLGMGKGRMCFMLNVCYIIFIYRAQ